MPANTFLYEVAENLYRRFGTDLARVAIVFPNKRPAIYLRKWLGELIEQPLWSPPMMTVHEFILSSTNRLPADRLVQRFLLFEAYEEVFAAAGEPYNNRFEDFFHFAEILLNDFTELEANRAPIGDVYANIRAMGEMTMGLDYLTEEQQRYLERFWTSFSVSRLSHQQEKFLRLWEKLPAVYERFAGKLRESGLVDTGTAYRLLADGLQENKTFDAEYKHIAFVGFNALNRSELAIFNRYKETGKGLFFFDADRHYLDDPLQEAGRFLRRNLALFGNELEAGDRIRHAKKKMEIISVDGDAAQVSLVPQLLATIDDLHTQPEKTAVLLADESQLLPLLHTLPAGVRVNITMGFELKRSVIYPLVTAYLQFCESTTPQSAAVYYEPVFRLLEHPWLQQHEPAAKLCRRLQKEGALRVSLAELQEEDALLRKIFTPVTQPLALFEGIRYLLQWWAGRPDKEAQTAMLLQLSAAAWQQLNRLEGLLEKFSHRLSTGFVAETIRLGLSSLSVPLEGEPLEGLQVMGLLESRGLDFEQFILLQANDGILPKRAAAPTFLPDSIRRAYQLSVLENQDSIFAYVFYRLLQRSVQSWITYNALVTDQSTGEPSRFLAQLAYETTLQPERKQVAIPLKAYWKEAITIEKTAPVMALLNRFSNRESKMSPSAFNTYLDCRLKFYFQYLAQIKEPDEFLTDPDSRTVGNIFHKTLEILYARLAGQGGNGQVDKAGIALLREWLPEAVGQAFAAELTQKTDTAFPFSGSLLVLREIIAGYVKKVLDVDEHYAPFAQESLEREIMMQVPITVSGRRETIWMGGYIDRVDLKEGVYRIVDYKTGMDDKNIPSVESLFDRGNTRRNKAALQTFIYARIWRQGEAPETALETGLYDVRAIGKTPAGFSWQFVFKGNGAPEKIDHRSFAPLEDEIWGKVTEVLEEIYNPFVPFDQTILVEKCERCAYNKLCGR